MDEKEFKSRILDLYNYSLNEIHNNVLDLDKQLEMKTAIYK
jgi:hypothetical protein